MAIENHTRFANELTSSMLIHPGEMIKDEIMARGITQKELARQMGVSYTVFNEILNGKRPVTTEYAMLLEAALGTDANIRRCGRTSLSSNVWKASVRLPPSFEQGLLVTAPFDYSHHTAIWCAISFCMARLMKSLMVTPVEAAKAATREWRSEVMRRFSLPLKGLQGSMPSARQPSM